MKNNNKGIVYRLAWKSLKASKMRTVLILLTIVLSVGLLSGLAFFSSAIEETNRKELAKRQHVIYHDVSSEQIDQIRQEEQVSYSGEFKRGKSFEVENYILMPYYIEQNESPMINLHIIQGEYPKEVNQVLVEKKLLDLMGLEAKIGETLDITFLDGTTEKFQVSGLIDSENEANVFFLYLSKEYAKSGSQLRELPFDIAVQIFNAEKMNRDEFLSVIRQIGSQYGVERKNINQNNSFVNSLSYNSSEMIAIILIGFSILLVSVLVIYSIFYISVSERTRQFGQLRTIGMTKKQIKKMIRIEGAILSTGGSCIGIIIGALFAFSMKPQGFNLSAFVIYSVAILIADHITVGISILKPAKIAADISPIEASKLSGYEIKKNKKMTKKLHRRLSPLSLSFIAVCGNRKKAAMTIISLSLAGIVFMCASTYISSMDEEKFSRQSWFKYGEFVLELSSNAAQVNEFGYTGIKQDNPLNNLLTDQLKDIFGVKDIIALQSLNVAYTYNNVTESEDIAAPFSEEEALLLQDYIINGELDYKKMIQNKEILICYNDVAKEIFGWKFQIGDQVKFKWFNGETYVEDVFTIAGELKETISNNDEAHKTVMNAGWFLVPKELLNQMMIPGFNLNTRIIISCNDYINTVDSIEKELDRIIENNPSLSLSTLKNSIEYHKEMYDTIYGTAMGASLFVIGFSLINLLNTLITNVMARKKEFACFRTLGMSEKQIAAMIQGEGLYFALVNILVTLLPGSLFGYGLVKLMVYSGISYMDYQFPLAYLAVYIIAVTMVPVFISSIIVRNLRKKSLVDRLRESD